ncbi:hypothetical protein DL96DRAFT_1683418 [Flagelloscypha sp. PMI_526]|nr:hypothetical protein DL96DRAFT_1683418 [Flagelloscypha sp. PMI_526]
MEEEEPATGAVVLVTWQNTVSKAATATIAAVLITFPIIAPSFRNASATLAVGRAISPATALMQAMLLPKLEAHLCPSFSPPHSSIPSSHLLTRHPVTWLR